MARNTLPTYKMAMLYGLLILAAVSLALSSTGTGTATAGDLVLAVHPYRSASVLIRRFNPLADYLSKAAGRPVRVQVSQDYASHVDGVGQGKVDLAYLGPAPYVDLVRRYGPQRTLARLEVNGRPDFVGHIVVRAPSALRQLSDLRGRRMAFGDPGSTMSHLVPRHMLRQVGVTVDDLAGHAFLDGHDNVAYGVLMGDFDAGAVKEAVFEKYRTRGLRSLILTPRISEHLFVAAGPMTQAEEAVLRSALLQVHTHPDGRQILQSIKNTVTALVPAVDSDYANLRTILEELRAEDLLP